ncbi:hypothetical protein [Pandoraea iniqua]|nr:hypothetical protein [Pandoraea iniqua]
MGLWTVGWRGGQSAHVSGSGELTVRLLPIEATSPRYPWIAGGLEAWISTRRLEDAKGRGLGRILIERLSNIDLKKDALFDASDEMSHELSDWKLRELAELIRQISSAMPMLPFKSMMKLTPHVTFAATVEPDRCAELVRLDIVLGGALTLCEPAERVEWCALTEYVMSVLQSVPSRPADKPLVVDLTPYPDSWKNPLIELMSYKSSTESGAVLPEKVVIRHGLRTFTRPVTFCTGPMDTTSHVSASTGRWIYCAQGHVWCGIDEDIVSDRSKRHLDAWKAGGDPEERRQVAVDEIHSAMTRRKNDKRAGVFDFSAHPLSTLPQLLELQAMCAQFREIAEVKQIILNPHPLGFALPAWLTANFVERTSACRAMHALGGDSDRNSSLRYFFAHECDPFAPAELT